MRLDRHTLGLYFEAAAAVAANPDDINRSRMYRVLTAGNTIYEEWVGDKGRLRSVVLIARNARLRSPALYIMNRSQRRIFYVDEANLLRCVKFRPDNQSWEDVPLQYRESLSISKSSHLSGVIQKNGHQLVFFESDQCHLSVIRIRDGDTGEWDALPAPPVDLMPGGFHQVLLSDPGGGNIKDLHFFYVHKDGTIHRSRLLDHDFQAGSWQGKRKQAPRYIV
ncbi:hypothetical protein VTH06DRAFT_4571 [Thermothelomyces fergusii]